MPVVSSPPGYSLDYDQNGQLITRGPKDLLPPTQALPSAPGSARSVQSEAAPRKLFQDARSVQSVGDNNRDGGGSSGTAATQGDPSPNQTASSPLGTHDKTALGSAGSGDSIKEMLVHLLQEVASIKDELRLQDGLIRQLQAAQAAHEPPRPSNQMNTPSPARSGGVARSLTAWRLRQE